MAPPPPGPAAHAIRETGVTAKTESAVKDADTRGQSVVLEMGRLVRRIDVGWVELGGGLGPKWRQN